MEPALVRAVRVGTARWRSLHERANRARAHLVRRDRDRAERFALGAFGTIVLALLALTVWTVFTG